LYIILTGVISVYNSCTTQIKNQKRTVATYTGSNRFGSMNFNEWEYIINGKKQSTSAWDGRAIGAKYIMVYDSLSINKYGNVDKSMIDGRYPVFIEGEKTDNTIGIAEKTDWQVLKTSLDSIEGNVLFKYQVNGKGYKSYQYYKTLKSNLPQKGNEYEVQYWVDDPARSIIHIEKHNVKGQTNEWYKSAQLNEWYKYESNEFGFKIEFPGEPEIDTNSVDPTLVSKYKTYIIKYFPKKRKRDVNLNYGVSFTEYPVSLHDSEKMDEKKLEHFYKKIIDNNRPIIKETKSIAEKIITYEGYTGMEVSIYFKDKGETRTRIFLIKNHLYITQVEISCLYDEATNPSVKRFMDSFELLDMDEKERISK